MAIETEELVASSPVVRPKSIVHRLAMRRRRTVVRLHRWLSFALLAWITVVSLTGGWLTVHDTVESRIHRDRYRHTSGDVGLQAAADTALAAMPEGSTILYAETPENARGVYKLSVDALGMGAGTSEDHPHSTRLFVYVDPGTGDINAITRPDEGFTWWVRRGHRYLWQDNGLFGVFEPNHGWCRPDAAGAEPGGVKGAVCDVIPDGFDTVAWPAMGWIVVLLGGFYLWYWPGVRRWATALAVRRGRGAFTFNLTLHKAIGIVVWFPLVAIAVTGATFGFPSLERWYVRATPAADVNTREVPLGIASSPRAGRVRLGLDRIERAIENGHPGRRVDGIVPPIGDDGVFTAFVTRGFSPWTREDERGNTVMALDQYTGAVLYDGVPSKANVFDQASEDWTLPVHAGDFGGSATRVLWLGLALAPPALGLSGVLMNLIRRNKRSHREGDTISPPAGAPPLPPPWAPPVPAARVGTPLAESDPGDALYQASGRPSR